jgi:iron complex outermembrane recepter protein
LKKQQLWAIRPAGVFAFVTCFCASGAYAQQPSEEQLDEITVTGSRIVRRDFDANSPIMTVDRAAFENSSMVAIESVLNQMPQFVPAVTQFDTQDVQQTATNTPGASTLSLRGLGGNRNLVLLDGRRAMPVNASMAVDINTIPAAAIERVETITGGASSVYGADAMAGVVNFILRKDFEGINLDTQYGETFDGVGAEFRLNGLFGANFDNGRGNVLIGVDHAERDPVLKSDIDFYKAGWADPTVNGTEAFFSATAYAPSFFNRPAQGTVNSIFSAAPANSVNSGNFFLNADGTVYTGGADFGASQPAGAYRYNGPLTVNGVAFRKIDAQGHIEENQIQEMASIPLNRYSIFGRGRYDITDNISAFIQGNFAESHTETLLQYSPASGPWSVNIPHGTGIYAASVDGLGNTLPAYRAGGAYGLNCAATGGCTNSQAFPTPPELTALLDSRPLPNDLWQLNRVLDFAGPRSTIGNTTTYQTVIGLEGAMQNLDWTWEAYASHGVTTGDTAFGGFGSLQRWRTLASAPNYGRGFFVTGNPAGGGFGAGTGRCTAGLPIFTQTTSQDCIDTIQADLKNLQRMEQNVVEFNLQGLITEMKAGELRFALGSSYRDNSYSFQTDILTSQESFIDSGIGLFPAGNSSGRTEVKELYGELLIPLIKDKGIFDELNLELGYRHSDNESVGGVDTYKALFDWTVNDRLRLRGGRQIANRAPNIGELFLSRTQTLNVSFIGDFCSTANGFAAVGANPAVNPDAAQALAICVARMGPGGAAAFYTNTQSAGGFSFSFENLVGNSALDIETAETYTLGAVISLADRTSLSIDFYQIGITDLIGAQSADNVYTECLSRATNPTFDPTAPACLLIVRDPANGNQGPTDVTYSNDAAVKTNGVDVQLNWGTDIGAGNFDLNFQITKLTHFETQLNPTSPFLDWTGSNGPTLNGLNGGSYDYRTFTTGSYSTGPWTMSVRWRHLPSIESGAAITSPATNFTPAAGAYDIFDMSGGLTFKDNYALRFGIDNLFDRDPEVTGGDVRIGRPGSTTLVANTGMGTTDTGFYDTLGRRLYIGLTLSF